MRTIGRHWPRDAPRGDYQAKCDYCGVLYRRSELVRDEAGLLVCAAEGEGLDVVALSRMSADDLRQPENYERDAPGVARDTMDGYVSLFTILKTPDWGAS